MSDKSLKEWTDEYVRDNIHKLKLDQSHGSPWDRGSADSYYGRPRDPHYWPEGTGHGTRVEQSEMTEEQVQAYLAGYQWNEDFDDKKDY